MDIKDLRNSMRITQTCRTICGLMGFEAPEKADAANPAVLASASAALEGRKAERVLLYNPDAIGIWLYQKYTERFIPVIRNTSAALPVLSVMPSVTPVCFGSMYTGLMPRDHGIQAYVKPVIKADSLFDAAIRAGKKPVIISTAGDSLTIIYKERPMDYMECATPDECNEKALETIAKNEHDIVLVYNANYDSTMHRNGPEAEISLAQIDHNAAAFETLCKACDKAWAKYDRVYTFLPDHGCHEIDGDLGSHGLDMFEDMNIIHFYGFRKGE
ncbi:MAG: alkaline phosphatase family protein [Firmicutes bacterium]|nr:alkaline phosphatase family protein [Bacillota bacterium]